MASNCTNSSSADSTSSATSDDDCTFEKVQKSSKSDKMWPYTDSSLNQVVNKALV